MPPINTAIVGAGPYGLSIAAHLRAAGIPCEVFGPPLESWRTFMPEGMFLRSEPFASNLWDPQRKFTLRRFSEQRGIRYQPVCNPLSLRQFLEYSEWFRQAAVGEVRDVKVQKLRRNSQNFILDLADGDSVESRRVVMATGQMGFRNIPSEISHLPEPLCMHSTFLGDVNQYRGRDCIIVGAGQSALESAALLHEAGAMVRILARASRINWNIKPALNRTWINRMREPRAGLGIGWGSVVFSELPRLFRTVLPAATRHQLVATRFGPAGAWWLQERVEGRIQLLLRHHIRSAHNADQRVRLVVEGPEGTKEILTDHVIAATGFSLNIDRLDYLDSVLKKNIAREFNAPVLDSSFETSVRGLFFVGAASAPIFGPAMRFVFGAKHAAPVLVRRLKTV